MIRAFPTFPDFVRTLPKAINTVFDVFLYIFKCEESIATIPETIRALSILPELSRSRKPPSKESIATIPEMIRALPTFPEFSRFCPNSPEGLKHRVWCLSICFEVRGIDCDYSRNDPSPPDLARTLPKPKTTVFGVFT
ncbi:hypothetical protein NQ317_007202 [Molorchus minor]|uniref:Uncharacterized protein n=1 Tax=Molorchus minor TaxID=1323400 RepID=A0ABQ9IT66_9CUCU|nr:hypothetical protein NQ317_007202 [Molorchus minor]